MHASSLFRRALATLFAIPLAAPSLAVASAISVGVGDELRFADCIPGDGPGTVAPASPHAASFVLQAPAEHHFVVLLPMESEVTLRHELGTAPDLRVLVEGIQCAPACARLESAGRVGADGKATFRVGAVAGTKRITLPAGTYSAPLVPTIILP